MFYAKVWLDQQNAQLEQIRQTEPKQIYLYKIQNLCHLIYDKYSCIYKVVYVIYLLLTSWKNTCSVNPIKIPIRMNIIIEYYFTNKI